LVSCSRGQQREPTRKLVIDAGVGLEAPPSVLATPPGLGPLTAEPSLMDLPVEGHLPAIAAIPVGVVERRPIAVIAHGMWGGPHWDCPMWRGVLGGYVFVLCPRGIPRPGQPKDLPPSGIAYTHASLDALGTEIEAGLTALRARYGAWMDEEAPLLVGCSLGAFYGATLGIRDPRRFPRLMLIEGGHDPWTADSARRFLAGGGDRVLFVCGQPDCVAAANAKTGVLRAAGVPVRVVARLGSGHSCHGDVALAAKGAIPWLTERDPRWLSGVGK
jgi:hypothetical protein